MDAMSSTATLFEEAIALESAGKLTDAEIAYRCVVMEDNQHTGAYINIGVLCYKRSSFDEAIKHYELALAVDPNYALAHYNLASALDAVGRNSEAVAHYNKALAISPTYADAHYNLALVYETIGEKVKALKHWRKYTILDLSGQRHNFASGRVKILSKQSGLFVAFSNTKPNRTADRARLTIL